MNKNNQPPNNEKPDRLSDQDAAVERLLDQLAIGSDQSSNEPQVVSAVNHQQEIDASLRRSFAPPEAPADLLARLNVAPPQKPAEPTTPSPTAEHAVEPVPSKSAPTRRTLPNWAVAAVLLIGLGAWGFQAREWFTPDESTYGERNIVALYSEAVDRGFEPDWFCEDEKRFAETFAERQGEGVWLRELPEGIRMAGLAYRKGLSPNATCLLAWVDDQPVLVAVDRRGQIPSRLLTPPPEEDVQVFIEQLGELTIVEVTPFDEPRVAPSLYRRDPPSEPTGRVPGS